MKKQLKKLLNRLLNWSIVWALVEATLGRASNIYRLIKGLKVWDEKAYSEYNTRLYNDTLAVKILDGRVRQLFSSLAVLTGPFKGMQYPRFNAFGSALYSKLLGSYEMELHNVFNQALTVNYNNIIDIGCAEGYYAVGVGMKIKCTTVYAFDTNNQSLAACREMAELNGVSNLITGGFCGRACLKDLDLGHRSLIISDCEGFENELFDRDMALHLINHDLLIECHDRPDIETTAKMLDAFSQTHLCRIITSTDDIAKTYEYSFEELSNFSRSERLYILAENRGTIMRWIFAQSKPKDH